MLRWRSVVPWALLLLATCWNTSGMSLLGQETPSREVPSSGGAGTQVSETEVSPQEVSPQEVSPQEVSAPQVSAQEASAQGVSAQDESANARPESSQTFTSNELNAWIEQLDDARYEVRTLATERLSASNQQAIPLLEKAIETGSLELRTRIVYVLRSLALSRHATTELQAMSVLERLAATPDSTGVRAADVLQQLAQIRETRSLKRLQELGATIEPFQETVYSETPVLVIDSDTWQGTLEDLNQLRWIRQIKALQLTGEHVSDAWLEHAAKMPDIQYLAIKRAEISSQGLAVLAQMATLQQIDVFYSPVGDDCVPHFQPLQQLRRVRMFGTKMSPEGAVALQNQLQGGVLVEYKRGAFLGVHCEPAPNAPCVVMEVTAQGAAARAGIRARDILVRYNDKPIASFDDLKAHIAGNEPGDKAVITVLRGARGIDPSILLEPEQALGIKAETHPLGLLVQEVTDKSAAARAGLRTGDILFAVGTERLATVEQLEGILRKMAEAAAARFQQNVLIPDLTQPIEGVRGYETLKLDVVFGEWE